MRGSVCLACHGIWIMRLGLLADIHEEVDLLRSALAHFARCGVDQVVVLGDIFETGRNIEPAARLLQEAGAVGVWGNHELGLCHEPEPELVARYPAVATQFMATLKSQWELENFFFTHAISTIDPTDPFAYYSSVRPQTPEARDECFARFPHRVMLMGHYHRWMAATPERILAWEGEGALDLSQAPMLVVIHAVMQGFCAVLDTNRRTLSPHRLQS